MKHDGLYINRFRIDSPEVKDQARKSLYGWKKDSLSLDSWLSDHIDQGHVVIIGDMNRCPVQNRYRHKKDLWAGTHIIAIDADEIEFIEDGEEILSEGAPPFQGTVDAWIEKNDSLCSLAYAIGESVTSMIKGEPKHRRFRLWIICEVPITSIDAYKLLLKGLASTFDIIPDVNRQPAQPVYGSCAPYRIMTEKTDFSSGGIYDTGYPVRTIRLGNYLDKDQISHYINLGVKMSNEKKKDRMPERKERRRDSITGRGRTNNSNNNGTLPDDNAVNRLGASFEIAKSFLEQHGSTFMASSKEKHEFTRAGKDEGGGEVLLISENGTLVFYAHSENSWFVLNGYCSANEGIPFSRLYCSVKYDGYSFLQCLAAIIKEYPHLDTGWRPDKKVFEDLKPYTALNYNMDIARKYIIQEEGEDLLDIRNPRHVEPGFDDRIIIFWGERWTLFSDYFVYTEDYEAERDMLLEYDKDRPDHKEAFIRLNDLAAQYTGNTGGWGQERRNRRISGRTFRV